MNEHDLDIPVVPLNTRLTDDAHVPTIGERLRIKKVGFIDETTRPEEGKTANDSPKHLAVIVKNYRGFMKGRTGRKAEGAYKDGLYLAEMPNFLPFEQIDEFCSELQRLKKAGELECAKTASDAAGAKEGA